jgi:hypothetical protein
LSFRVVASRPPARRWQGTTHLYVFICCARRPVFWPSRMWFGLVLQRRLTWLNGQQPSTVLLHAVRAHLGPEQHSEATFHRLIIGVVESVVSRPLVTSSAWGPHLFGYLRLNCEYIKAKRSSECTALFGPYFWSKANKLASTGLCQSGTRSFQKFKVE